MGRATLTAVISLSLASLLWACGSSGGTGPESYCPDGTMELDGRCVADWDDDQVPDVNDNCPDTYNPHQEDLNHNDIGDLCEDPADGDQDIADRADVAENQPDTEVEQNPDLPAEDDALPESPDEPDLVQDPDPAQDAEPDAEPDLPADLPADTAADPEPDREPEESPHDPAGTVEDPFIIPYDPTGPDYEDRRDTTQAASDRFDSYPPDTLDESGSEYVYRLTVTDTVDLLAYIDFPEPEGVDIDLHLVESIEPLTLVARGHYQVTARLNPGVYWLIMDTYVEDGAAMAGPYHLTVALTRVAAGTLEDPIVLNEVFGLPLPLPFSYGDTRDTSQAQSDRFDSYPPISTNESGPEYVYVFTVDKAVRVSARIATPEPDGVDIDLHLCATLAPLDLVVRDNTSLYAELDPGTYWLVMDTYASGGVEKAGAYQLYITVRDKETQGSFYFNDYILAAVDYLYANYGLLGYTDAALTHDLPYGDLGVVPAQDPPRTMCVAAVMETMLTAMWLYATDTGDDSVWDFLPLDSWRYLRSGDIKAHIWVNHDLDSYGTADALVHFGMGETVAFEDLQPGGVININRTTGSGHAVVFLAFVDETGAEYDSYNDNVIGFKYFSSQGSYNAGSGGFDFRYALFETDTCTSTSTCPTMPYLRDLHVIRSANQQYLNTGLMWSPENWVPTSVGKALSRQCQKTSCPQVSFFDASYFTGQTTEDYLLRKP